MQVKHPQGPQVRFAACFPIGWTMDSDDPVMKGTG